MGLLSIEPSEVGATGLAWLLITYGYVLYYASNLISEGSDLLLLVPSMASFVGGTVLPLLGAVPDGAILLFSGIGDIETAQQTLSVGVGALAGSTIMLLTVPWALSVIGGRVDFIGEYNSPNYFGKPKLQTKGGLCNAKTYTHTGCGLTKQVKDSAVVMMITTLPYLLIQIPASIYESQAPSTPPEANTAFVARKERFWALVGFIICIVGFISYLYFQVETSQRGAEKMKRIAVTKKFVQEGVVSLSGIMGDEMKRMEHECHGSLGTLTSKVHDGKTDYGALNNRDEIPPEIKNSLKDILRDVFRKYDKDKNGRLEPTEFKEVLHDLNEPVEDAQLKEIFDRHDTDHDGTISFDEFVLCIWASMWQRTMHGEDLHIENLKSDVDVSSETAGAGPDNGGSNNNGEVESEEDIPQHISTLPPHEQQKAIKRSAFTQLAIGTTLVVLFSDPMVDVLQEVANRINISPFYVSFVLAPLASNASEVIASQYYAAKKTRKTMTVSLTALEGAASMNNTFCLSILLGLIYFRGLCWEFTAETIAILTVEVIVGIFALRKSTQSVGEALIIMSLFPLSIALVAILEAIGFD